MRTSLIISLSQFRENIKNIRKKLEPETKFLAVVKADAYGHGALKIAKTAEKENVDYFGVATLDEAIELREGGVQTPILILTEPLDNSISRAFYYDVSLTIYSKKMLNKLARLKDKYSKPIKLHLKVDTGMNRIGIQEKEVIPFIKEIKKYPNFYLEGLLTHLAESDNKCSNYANEQYDRFFEIINLLKKNNIEIPLIHMANSGAIINFPRTQLDMVRTGIALYKNVATFKTRILQIKYVQKNEPIGYSRGFVASEKIRIAVLSVGYADGYSRLLSNKGAVLIKGQHCPIVGNICMDISMVSIPEELNINVGDEVTLIGDDNDSKISVDDIADLMGTISYEVLCSIGKRAIRIYN